MDEKPQGDQQAAQAAAAAAGPGTKADGICTVPGKPPFPSTKAECDAEGGTWTRKQ